MNMSPPGGYPARSYDLLVPAPDDALHAVWTGLRDLLRLWGKPLAMIALLTAALPQILSGWVNTAVAGGPVWPAWSGCS